MTDSTPDCPNTPKKAANVIDFYASEYFKGDATAAQAAQALRDQVACIMDRDRLNPTFAQETRRVLERDRLMAPIVTPKGGSDVTEMTITDKHGGVSIQITPASVKVRDSKGNEVDPNTVSPRK